MNNRVKVKGDCNGVRTALMYYDEEKNIFWVEGYEGPVGLLYKEEKHESEANRVYDRFMAGEDV